MEGLAQESTACAGGTLGKSTKMTVGTAVFIAEGKNLFTSKFFDLFCHFDEQAVFATHI